MALDWLKGLVAPPAQFIQPGQPYSGTNSYPGAMPPAPTAGPPQGGAPAWTPTGQPPAAPSPFALQPGNESARITALEARCETLQRDLEAVALFARALLTLLQERQLVTPEQFLETKNKLDMLDGKLDNRVAP